MTYLYFAINKSFLFSYESMQHILVDCRLPLILHNTLLVSNTPHHFDNTRILVLNFNNKRPILSWFLSLISEIFLRF
jgi:hypothetical protein